MALTTGDDVAAMLRWGDAEKTKHSDDIAVYVAAAIEVVEHEAGPFELGQVVHTADGGASVALPSRVSAIASVTVDGSVVTGWTLDRNAAIIYGPFGSGRQNVVVTYTTGFTVVPPAAKLAATMVAADMWAIASQRAPGLDDQVDPGYLVPAKVRQLLAPFKTIPGFA